MSANTLDVESTLSQLTLQEKIALLSGSDFWHTHAIPRLRVPSIRMSDGPNGIRGTRFFNCTPAACFPCGTALAATWDPLLLRRIGVLMADEARAKGVHVILGPTVNIHRSPLGGRGFECFGEDPLLSGRLAAAEIGGIRSKGVAAAIKHFVCNEQEYNRKSVNCIVSSRALREIYLRPFEIALEAEPWALMTTYSKVNGTHVSENPFFLKRLLRDEWQYRGLVMSDWFGSYSTSEALVAGLDLEMPGRSIWRGNALSQALRGNKVTHQLLDERVRSVLNLVQRCIESNTPEFESVYAGDSAAATTLLHEASCSSIVLLKNDHGVLPFSADKTVAVLGPNAKIAVVQGGGSASVKPTYAVSPLEGIKSRAKADVAYSPGVSIDEYLPLMTGNLLTPCGRPGVLLKFFKEFDGQTSGAPFDEVVIDDTIISFMDYTHHDLIGSSFFVTLEALFRPDVDGEFLFGLTVCGVGKLFVNDQLVVDNATNQTPGKSFFGSGTREEVGSIRLSANEVSTLRVEFGTPFTQSNPTVGATNVGAGGLRLGCTRNTDPEEELADAIDLAKTVDQVVVCVGLNGDLESEGFDRQHLNLPGRSNDLIHHLIEANPNVAVVVQSGTPVTMPWAHSARAIVHAWYGGNETGNAIADVLFGNENPSGKLPISFPLRVEDTPSFLNFGSEAHCSVYGEGVFVGYRYYEKLQTPVLFPFEHGLSYSKFTMLNIRLRESQGLRNSLIITLDLHNESPRPGKEVVQAYVGRQTSAPNRPVKELKGFSKVLVPGHDTTSVEIIIDRQEATRIWDESKDMWVGEKGLYDVFIGCSSHDVAVAGSFSISKTEWWTGVKAWQ